MKKTGSKELPRFQEHTKAWISQESPQEKKKRAKQLLSLLKKQFPTADMMLRYENPIQLLVAVMLSAQCTDKKVNEVTATLFNKYKTAYDFAHAHPREFEQEIYQTGFYRAKTKNIIAATTLIEEKFDGKLPKTMASMLTLPGVARKTANVVLGNAYQIYDGIAVDTHVSRLAQRLGFSENTDPKKIEQDLMAILPKEDWFKITYLLIELGRALCTAPRRKCETCPLNKICPSSLK